MYLAPLNYNRYFKKVFSDTGIAKRFLEDFFDTKIDSIELLTTHHKLTDETAAVEFDFRCRIQDQFVIIDMQQWYKPDIVHRFYTYHCINTALQLESMPLKSMYLSDDKERKTKDYSDLLPVITLIWMVDDTLNFIDDYIIYSLTPEIVTNFVTSKLLWQNKEITELLRHREQALSRLNNRTKRLDFLYKNKLIYAFQKNIVKNQKFSKYFNWFELAEKSRNKLNQKADFLKYAEDDIFVEIMRRISRETLKDEDFTYIDDYEKFIERVQRYEKGIYEDGKVEGIEIGKEQGIEIGKEQGIEIGKDEEKLAIAKRLKQKGMDAAAIFEITGISESRMV
jgi:hypothetical protein